MGLVGDAVKGIAGGLVPPQDADPDHVFKYRLSVSASIFFGGVVVAGHIIWACGFLASIGLSGFALSSDVQSQNARLLAMQETQLTQIIRGLKKDQCVAIVQKNPLALRAVTTNIQDREAQYRTEIGHDPSVPRCDELLIGAATGE